MTIQEKRKKECYDRNLLSGATRLMADFIYQEYKLKQVSIYISKNRMKLWTK